MSKTRRKINKVEDSVRWIAQEDALNTVLNKLREEQEKIIHLAKEGDLSKGLDLAILVIQRQKDSIIMRKNE